MTVSYALGKGAGGQAAGSSGSYANHESSINITVWGTVSARLVIVSQRAQLRMCVAQWV